MRKPKRICALSLGLVALLSAVSGCASNSSGSAGSASPSAAVASGAVDLNSLSLDELIEKAEADGDIQSVGMPDSWANWGETWQEIHQNYGITHTDTDMSSAEELALFEAEKNDPTKDIGDIGHSYGPLAESKGLTLAYKTSYWDDVPDWAKDDNGDWIIAYYGTIAFLTNTNIVKEDAPRSWQDILNGSYKVTVGDVTSATTSQNAVLAAAYAFGGDESNIQPGIDFFAKIAEQGRLDLGDIALDRIEKGECEVTICFDFNALGARDAITAANPNASFEVHVPTDGSVQSGYCTIINKYAPHPYAAALAREYILSDEGQINLAKGYAKPIRSDVVLPNDVASKLIPDEEYVKAQPIKDYDAWEETVSQIGEKWQNEVLAKAS
jgi:putative spermidine/putrescine transport system substrate-binding protein